jgi:hypothetical protein
VVVVSGALPKLVSLGLAPAIVVGATPTSRPTSLGLSFFSASVINCLLFIIPTFPLQSPTGKSNHSW